MQLTACCSAALQQLRCTSAACTTCGNCDKPLTARQQSLDLGPMQLQQITDKALKTGSSIQQPCLAAACNRLHVAWLDEPCQTGVSSWCKKTQKAFLAAGCPGEVRSHVCSRELRGSCLVGASCSRRHTRSPGSQEPQCAGLCPRGLQSQANAARKVRAQHQQPRCVNRYAQLVQAHKALGIEGMDGLHR